MKINTRQVKEAGTLTANVQIPPQKIDSNPPFGLAYPEPFELSLTATAIEEDVVIRGSLRWRARLTCSRCLEEYLETITAGFEVSAGIEQGDVDLTSEMSQAAVLAIPMKPLCRHACLGLCPHCGQNMNAGRCSCKPSVPHPSWEALKNLKLGSE